MIFFAHRLFFVRGKNFTRSGHVLEWHAEIGPTFVSSLIKTGKKMLMFRFLSGLTRSREPLYLSRFEIILTNQISSSEIKLSHVATCCLRIRCNALRFQRISLGMWTLLLPMLLVFSKNIIPSNELLHKK